MNVKCLIRGTKILINFTVCLKYQLKNEQKQYKDRVLSTRIFNNPLQGIPPVLFLAMHVWLPMSLACHLEQNKMWLALALFLITIKSSYKPKNCLCSEISGFGITVLDTGSNQCSTGWSLVELFSNEEITSLVILHVASCTLVMKLLSSSEFSTSGSESNG